MVFIAIMPARAQQALVLGGGGSRGLAHAGAITGIAERGWDPDLIVGTSMGAIIGALYAVGLSPDSIWKVAYGTDWRESFFFPAVATAPGRAHMYPMLQLGIGVDRTRYSEGIISDMRVNRTLTRLLFDAGARARSDFDSLPRSFRAVAADLATGEVVVLARGDLARAVRASMAVPAIFAPVLLNGRTLVDGGIANALPVGVANELGYTRVIGVDVIHVPVEAVALNPFQSGLRAFRLLVRNARPDDAPEILVTPDIDPNQSAAIFPTDATGLLVLGRDAARAQIPATAGDATIRSPKRPPGRILAVRVDAADEGLRSLVGRTFARTTGGYDPAAILDAADELLATGLFHGVWPHVQPGGPDGDTLVVVAEAVPPFTLAGGAAWESDRGGRLWAMLRARPSTNPVELAFAIQHEEMHALASVGLRRPLAVAPATAWVAAATIEESDVRLFDGREMTGERDVLRSGAAIGLEWRRLDPDWVASGWLRAEYIDAGEDSTAGFAAGPHVRFERIAEVSRVVGISPMIEAETRFGQTVYHRGRARGSIRFTVGALEGAVLTDATITSDETPIDAMPALGDEHLIPGLAWGRYRDRARLIAGLDLALRIMFDAHARLRLRVGGVGDTFGTLDQTRWIPGAEAGVTWWSPLGRIEAGLGIASRERPRIDIVLGAVF